MKKILPSYSGPRSTKFWNRINALPQPAQRALYDLGCRLQALESSLLQRLVVEEALARTRKKTTYALS